MTTAGSYYNEYFQLLGEYFTPRVVIRLEPQGIALHPLSRQQQRLSIGRVYRNGVDYLLGQAVQRTGESVVVLDRQVGGDDYLRFRIPDTWCPPLPEPAEPLDSGMFDEAEPFRWVHSSSNLVTEGGWQFWNGGWVRTAYACYAPQTPFRVEVHLSNQAIGGGILMGPIPVPGLTNFTVFDLFCISYGSVWVGAGYRVFAEVIEPPGGLGVQGSDVKYGYSRHGWVVAWKSVLDQGIGGMRSVPIHTDRGWKQLVLMRGSDYVLRAGFRYLSGGQWVDGITSDFTLGTVPTSHPIEFRRRVLVTEGALTPEQMERWLMLSVPFVMGSARTVLPRSLSSEVETTPFDFDRRVLVRVAGLHGFTGLRWRATDQIDTLSGADWSSDAPTVPRRYWQFQLALQEQAPYENLGERVDLDLVSEEEPPSGGGGPPRRDMDLDSLIPRNLGVYWTYGHLPGSFYGTPVQLPASIYTALFAGLGWIGRMDHTGVPTVWDCVPYEGIKPLLRHHYICHLDLDSTGAYLQFPADSVDSVGSRIAMYGLWISALLKPYLHRWLGAPVTGSVRQDVVNTVDAALRALPGVRNARCQLIAARDTILLKIEVWLYGIVERIAFDIVGSVAGGIDVRESGT